jgi:transcriptional regulator with XRE-family HTH domain
MNYHSTNMSLLKEINEEVDVDEAELRLGQRRMALIQQINEALERKGWTQARLADEMGKKDSQITRLLSPTSNPTLRTLVEIEEALGQDLITVNRNLKYKKRPELITKSERSGSRNVTAEELAEEEGSGGFAGDYEDVREKAINGELIL